MATNITEFSKRVQPDVQGCPKVMVDNVVIDALIQFCKDTHFLEKSFEHDVVTADIVTSDNNSVNVLLTTYIGASLRPILLTELKIDGGKWNAQKLNLMNDVSDIAEISFQGVKFFVYPDRTHIKFYDIDAKDQRFYIKQVYVPLPSIATIDDELYDDYHETVEAWAKWKLMSMPKKDWTDGPTAMYNLGLYNDGMASAKIKKDQGSVKGSTSPKSMRWF